MKIAVIGGGSTYTPELASGLLQQVDLLPLKELWLMDISSERLEVVGGFVQRMVAAAGSPFEVHLSSDQRRSIRDTEYVITQIRVGGMQARREDEYLGKHHGLIGQETNGVGGMANALRTIPVILQIASEVRELAPNALLINFTNPSGIVTEALMRYAPQIQTVGLCNGPITTKMQILKILEEGGLKIDPEKAYLDSLGVNHFGWYRGLIVDGVDLWSEFIGNYDHYAGFPWDAHTIKALGVLPNTYLKYYYDTAKLVEEQEKWPPSRAEQVRQIETELLQQYAECDRVDLPDGLMKRGGSYYSTLATYVMRSHYNDLGEIHTVNVRHAGAVEGYPEDWVLELPCKITRSGMQPLSASPLPLFCYGQLAVMKAFELLTVEAAVHSDLDAAYQALLANPLGPAADRIELVLKELLRTNRLYLPQFA